MAMKRSGVILSCGISACILVYLMLARTTFLIKVRMPPKSLVISVDDKAPEMKMSSSMRDWERMTLHDPQVTHWRSIASSINSNISIVNKKTIYFVGDIVTVKIKVRDVDGHRKTKGGDEIRIWTRGGNFTGAAGTVVDNGDGTYLGRVKLLWPGSITIKAKVFTPREKIAYLYRNVRYGNTSRMYFGEFSDGSVNETVPCTGSFNISRTYKGSCNLKNKNNGSPWFCEKPKQLACSNWAFTVLTRSQYNLTRQQLNMLIITSHQGLMGPPINITAVKSINSANKQHERSGLQSSVPCNKIPARETWRARTPLGYVYKGSWIPLICSSNDSRSVNSTRECLKGRRVWFIGDSTTRQMFEVLKGYLRLTLTTQKWEYEKWYDFSIAEDKLRTISVAFATHGLPFGFGGRKTATNKLVATHKYISTIPAGSKDIVVVHFYSHFHTQHPDVLRQSVRKTVKAIRNLKHRAPKATVVVKGPHAMPKCGYPSNDFWGIIATEILREEFRNLQNYVIYLDLWDMTVSNENLFTHPGKETMRMIMNYLMSLVCPQV